jgi:predicted phosphoribosyltransferase
VIKAQINKTMDVIKKRDRLFRNEAPFPSLKNKNIIIVDDGLASGYTMFAAIECIKKRNPWKVIVAVPTGSEKTVEFILSVADEVLCLNIRSRFPFAIADAYRNWYDLTDEEVMNIIKSIS